MGGSCTAVREGDVSQKAPLPGHHLHLPAQWKDRHSIARIDARNPGREEENKSLTGIYKYSLG